MDDLDWIDVQCIAAVGNNQRGETRGIVEGSHRERNFQIKFVDLLISLSIDS